MEDVTDTVFREIVLSIATPGRLSVLFTEFVSTDGLCHPTGRKKVSHRLYVNPSERIFLKEKGVKLVAQVWGSKPEKFREAIRLIAENYQFDGIDINMGCPVKKIVKQGGCSALIGQPNLAKEIVLAAKESSPWPVSVKTRTGIKQHITAEWIGHLLETQPAAIILHCRTQADQSEKPADHSQMQIAIEVRNRLQPEIPLIGNGDLFNWTQINHFIQTTGANGAMVGRGIFQNPWMFGNLEYEPIPQEKINLLLKHAQLFENTWAKTKNFSILKRFFKIYLTRFENASHLKALTMESNNRGELVKLLDQNKY